MGLDLFVHFKRVKVVLQSIAYKYGAFLSQPISQRVEKQNRHLIPSAQSLLTSQLSPSDMVPSRAGRSD